ncbi:hypothetical protein R1T16_13120 [Flavobacterium sp. DG1-102-2]|uniref:hypothetical protein n=1 Tax=Flavobacterium sp. DG1-102-2 TaxID=3081663 RepID=UPI00294A848C|nr:hypothetical protein [Flavobacterium sp. DG1-102-2]MDV6169370.1 hypothetical protein [Flavobacterium sp. DG1-102-2]
MKYIIIIVVSVFLFSCDGVSNRKEGNLSTDGKTASKGREGDTVDFSKTKFTDRGEELIYIRNYIEYRLPKVLIEAEPAKMEEALEDLVGRGKDVTLEEAAKYTWMYDGAYNRLWYLVTQDNLSFDAVKKMLYSYDTLYPKGKQKAKKEAEILPVIDEKEVERPPIVEGKYNPDDERIRGDFNGDGKEEYAYRVLIKQGHGNPVEDGTPDEYEVHFSDKNIEYVKADCCGFRIINEGDLNNDGSDEFSIAQNPMNGCIGTFRTFTCKRGNCFELIEPFVFYRCNELSIEELKGFVSRENGVVYYREMNPDGGRLIKKRATITN